LELISGIRICCDESFGLTFWLVFCVVCCSVVVVARDVYTVLAIYKKIIIHLIT
jgi:hypothetical protein